MLPGPLKKAARKRHTEAIKQSREERCRRFANCPRRAACVCACPRPPARHPGTLEGDSSRPETDTCDARELWCFAGCLSPLLPPIGQATRRGRCVYVPFVPLPRLPYLRFCAARVPSCPYAAGRHIRAAVVAARSSYPRATLCADALVYRLQLQTPCVAKSSSAGDSSLANKGSPRATPRADPL